MLLTVHQRLSSGPALNEVYVDGRRIARSSAPPTLALTSPRDGANVLDPLHLAATASDPDGIARVDFAVDGAVVCSSTAAPYGCDDSPPAGGVTTRRVVTATAYDRKAQSSSSSVTVTSIL